jgi:hypothetical protein
MGKKSVKIQEIRELMAEYGATCIENIDIESLRELREAFESLEDQRFEPYVEHLLSDIVMITLTGLANADEWSQVAAFAAAHHIFEDDRNTTMRKNGAQNLQNDEAGGAGDSFAGTDGV